MISPGFCSFLTSDSVSLQSTTHFMVYPHSLEDLIHIVPVFTSTHMLMTSKYLSVTQTFSQELQTPVSNCVLKLLPSFHRYLKLSLPPCPSGLFVHCVHLRQQYQLHSVTTKHLGVILNPPLPLRCPTGLHNVLPISPSEYSSGLPLLSILTMAAELGSSPFSFAWINDSFLTCLLPSIFTLSILFPSLLLL